MKYPYAKLSVAALTVSLATLSAQVAPTPDPATPSEANSTAPANANVTPPPVETNTPDKVVVLDPFTVDASTDVGYVAVDSLAGGRANLPIKVTPAPISSLTRAFMDDVQLTNVRDALKWTAGAVPQNWRGGRAGSGNQFNSWAFSIRGQGDADQGGNPPTRNYFPNFVALDLYNVDRVEVARGPNSILFGVGDIGGSIATYTKVPRLDKEFQNAVISVNDNAGVRFTADVNSLAGENFALRTNLLFERERGWRQGDRGTTYALDLHALIKFSENSKLRIELEGYDRKNNLYAFVLQDTSSLWDRKTTSPTWGGTIVGSDLNPLKVSGAPGVKNMKGWGDKNALVWIPSLASHGLMDWYNGYRSIGTLDVGPGAYLHPEGYTFPVTGTDIQALPSRDFTVAPSDGYLRARYAALTLVFDQRINDNMEAEISAYGYADAQRSNNSENVGADGAWSSYDLNQQLPDGSPNPNFGKKYSDVFLSQQNQYHPAIEFRGQLNYHFDANVFNIPISQWMSAAVGYRRTELKPRTYLAFDQPINADNWTNHLIWGRLYWDNPRAAVSLPSNIGTYQAMPFNWFDFNLRETIKYGGIVSQTRLWNDRLNITLGARRDKYTNYKIGIRGPTNIPTSADETGTTFQAGAIGYVLSWLGITYNYAENFAPLAGGVAPTLYGEPLGAARGKGQSVGLRFTTNDGRYYASVTYYKDKSQGRPKGGPDFQGTWNKYIDGGGTATDIGPSGVITGTGSGANASMNFSDTTDLEDHGVEFEFVGNPTKDIRLQLNFSIPKSNLSNSIPNSQKYYAEHIDEWTALANTPSSDPAIQLIRDSFKTDLANLNKTIVGLSSTSVNGHLIKNTASFFGTYTFPMEALKGFSVGAGATHYGKQYGNPGDLVNGERILSPSYTVYNAMVAYTREFHSMGRNIHSRFQLNVDNLLDSDKLIYRSYQEYGDGLVAPLDFDYIEPRRWTLTASFEF
ncbi:MAG TPA: TonB-dependent receptor plug domain-containing protein [Opitutaceae bacterium]|nr:TonB-dependent receptor plug domain-containing protein [Opitutaceae bacterium]